MTSRCVFVLALPVAALFACPAAAIGDELKPLQTDRFQTPSEPGGGYASSTREVRSELRRLRKLKRQAEEDLRSASQAGVSISSNRPTPPQSDDSVLSRMPDAQPRSLTTILSESFNSGIPPGWSVVDNAGSGINWTNLAGCRQSANWTGGSGDVACATGDSFHGTDFDTELRTPVLNLSGLAAPATLGFKANYANYQNFDFFAVDVSTNGASGPWVNLLRWNASHGAFKALPGEAVTLDISSVVGQANVMFRFHYYDPNSFDSDWYVEVDDVVVTAGGTPPPPTNTGSCTPSSTTACLSEGRFKAQISWRNYQGQTGSAQTVPFSTDDSALFWFFSADNWEMLVKVIDGCNLNDRFWVYSAASTDVEYTLTVTDTLTNTQKVYTNPLGQAAPANTDSAAFATCDAGVAPSSEPEMQDVRYTREVAEALSQPELDRRLLEAAAASGACLPSEQQACLEAGRFSVKIHWRDYQGHTGEGHSVPFGSGNSGLFWFFNQDNWEMLVKVIDGCSLNDRFWVFAAATTDVEYTLTVTDTFTGTVQTYTNPLGQRSPALNDTSAFGTCAATSASHLDLLTAPSVALGAAGQTSDIEVRAVDAYGNIVPGAAITWATTDPSLASVASIGALRARVTAQSAGPGSTQIIAKWGTFETRIDVLLAHARPGAVVLNGDLVLSRTETHVSLQRTGTTEGLQPGQVVTSSGKWALLDRIGSKSMSASTVELEVSPSSYNQAFEHLVVDSPGAPAFFVARLRRQGASYAFARDASGRVQHFRFEPMAASALTFSCKYTNGSPAPVQVVGPDIEITAPLSLHPQYDSSTGELELAVEGQARVTILSGEVRFSSATSQAVSCSLSLPSIVLMRASIYGIGLSLDLKPVVGVGIQANTAGLLRLTGPVASAVGSVTGGLRYRPGTGWSTFSNRSFSGGINPATLGTETPSFTATIEASAGAETSIKAYLGLPIEGFGLNLAELTFLDVKGYGRASLTLPAPLTPSSPSYLGPSWSTTLGVRADLGVEVSSGQLPKLLRYFNISLALAGPYSLFDLQIASRTSPTFTIWSDQGSVNTGGSLLFSGAGSTTNSGSIAFWSRKDSATALSAIASGPFSTGAGDATFSPTASQVGSHLVRGRLYLDGISSVFPYASQNEIQIDVQEGGGGSGEYPREGLAAHWELDGAGVDSFGAYHLSTRNIFPTTDRVGRVGQAVGLSNSLPAYLRSDALLASPVGEFTWSGWAQVIADREFQDIVTNYDGCGEWGSFRLSVERAQSSSESTIQFWTVGGSPETWSGIVVPINSTGWHHFAITYSASAHRMELYFDGALAQSRFADSPLRYWGPADLWLGPGDCYGIYTPAALDDAFFYSRALNATEVSQIYHHLD